MQTRRFYQVVLVPEREGGYTVTVPALPGCVSYGDTVEDAIRNSKEAIELHLDNLEAHNQPLPGEEASMVFTTLVEVTHSSV
jgi:antitoxin HicB